MRSSEQIDQLAIALHAAQNPDGGFPVINKGHKAEVATKTGGKYSYDYADLEDVQSATLPVMHTHGLSITQLPEFEGGKDLLSTRLMHISGQWVEGTMRLPLEGTTPQGQGSGITYAKRYAWCAILGLRSDKDDDSGIAQRQAAEAQEEEIRAQRFGSRSRGDGSGRRGARDDEGPRGASQAGSGPNGESAPEPGPRKMSDDQLGFIKSLCHQVDRCLGSDGHTDEALLLAFINETAPEDPPSRLLATVPMAKARRTLDRLKAIKDTGADPFGEVAPTQLEDVDMASDA